MTETQDYTRIQHNEPYTVDELYGLMNDFSSLQISQDPTKRVDLSKKRFAASIMLSLVMNDPDACKFMAESMTKDAWDSLVSSYQIRHRFTAATGLGRRAYRRMPKSLDDTNSLIAVRAIKHKDQGPVVAEKKAGEDSTWPTSKTTSLYGDDANQSAEMNADNDDHVQEF